MFGIGGTELVIILVFGFLIFGPDKLPSMGRTIGRALRQFRQAQEQMNKMVQTEIYDPLNAAAKEPEKKQGPKKKTTAGSTAKPETFAEKKARLAAEASAEAERKMAPAPDAASEDAVVVPEKPVGRSETFAEKKARMEAEKKAAEAKEVPTPMIVGQVILAAVCVILGLGAPFIAPVFAHVAASVLATPALDVVTGAATENVITGTAMSTPLLAILLIAFVVLAIFGRKAFNHGLAPRMAQPWACGYEPDKEMPVIATSFASDVNLFLKPLYTIRDFCTSVCWKIAHFFEGSVDVARAVEPQPDKILVDDVAHGVDVLGRLAQKIVGGNYSVYILYIVVALVVFLVLAVTL